MQAFFLDRFMKAAIEEARKSLAEGGIPICSVLVKNEKIIGRGHNKRVQKKSPVLHAEIDCLQNAGRIGSYKGCVLYSTLMPCFFCSGAIVQFGIKKVFAGESKNFSGAKKFLQSQGVKVSDFDLEECKSLMQGFIKSNKRLWLEDIGKL